AMLAWIAATAAVFSWVIVPPVQKPSVWKSMSKTAGLTAEPPPEGGPEMLTLIPPVAGNRHAVPAELRAAWSWYCQRIPTNGRQQAPAAVLQGTGAGQPAVPHELATAGAAVADMTPTICSSNPHATAVSAAPSRLISRPFWRHRQRCCLSGWRR